MERASTALGEMRMTYVITIKMDNAAFHDDDGTFEPGYELRTILQRLANEHEYGDAPVERKILDSNGNTVGKAEVKDA